jgi:eukaryotic-like serine/threonine-protein kinase
LLVLLAEAFERFSRVCLTRASPVVYGLALPMGFERQPKVDDQNRRIGTVLLGRYHIVRRIGMGGMGAVYQAQTLPVGPTVAVKVLHPHFVSDQESVARFEREARATLSVSHPHVVEIIDAGRTDDGAMFTVMELLDGRDFESELQAHGPQPLARAAHIVAQVCDALSAAHRKNIIHRDLKPANIFLVERDGQKDFVKVFDFGLSKIRDDAASTGASLTRVGALLGTPHYMSPEQASGRRDIDHRSDVYAVGVILFRALTGHLPFEDATHLGVLLKITSEPAPSVRIHRPELPVEIEQIIAKLLAKNREDRFADCDAVRAALAPFTQYSGAMDSGDSFEDAPTMAAIPAHGYGSGAAFDEPQEPQRLTLTGESFARAPERTAKLSAVKLEQAHAALQSKSASVPTMPPISSPTARIATPFLARRGVIIAGIVGSIALGALGVVVATGGSGRHQSTATVRITIESTPPDAELYLDGQRIANPFDGHLPQSNRPHRIEARKQGFQTVIQEITLGFPQTVRLRLRPEGATEIPNQ